MSIPYFHRPKVLAGVLDELELMPALAAANVDAVLARTTEAVKIDSSSVGYLPELLRKQSLIWKSGRGVYAIEDTQHIAWLAGIPEIKLEG